MLEILMAGSMALAQAPDCAVAIESKDEAVLRLRPACPAGFARTHAAVREALAGSGKTEARLFFGRIVEYPWLSSALARQASSSRVWDPVAGTPRGSTDNAYVASVLRGMPEFGALFDKWQIAGISVEKVLLKPAAELPLAQGAPLPADSRLPYDAMLWVTLRKP